METISRISGGKILSIKVSSNMPIKTVDVSEVLFTQSTIQPKFIQRLVESIKSGGKALSDLPIIRVVEKDGKLPRQPTPVRNEAGAER